MKTRLAFAHLSDGVDPVLKFIMQKRRAWSADDMAAANLKGIPVWLFQCRHRSGLGLAMQQRMPEDQPWRDVCILLKVFQSHLQDVIIPCLTAHCRVPFVPVSATNVLLSDDCKLLEAPRHDHGHGEVPMSRLKGGLEAVTRLLNRCGTCQGAVGLPARNAAKDVGELWLARLTLDAAGTRDLIHLDSGLSPTTDVCRSLTELDIAWLRHRIATRCFEVAVTPVAKQALRNSAASASVSKEASDAGMTEWHHRALPVDRDGKRALRSAKHMPERGVWTLDDLRRLLQRFIASPDATDGMDVATTDQDLVKAALESIERVVNEFRHDQHISAIETHLAMSDMAHLLEQLGLPPNLRQQQHRHHALH